MSDKTLKNRSEINKKYKWNIEDMFHDESVIQTDIDKVLEMTKSYSSYAGKLTENGATLLNAFKDRDEIWQKLEKVFVYARMRRDEDNRDTKYQAMTDKCNSIIAQVSASMSFFTPEILDTPKDVLLKYIEEVPGLCEYSFIILDLLREKEHILTKSEENIMAQMGEITGATNDIFTMLNNADIKFGTIIDEDGDEVELTHGNYITFMESHDRSVRKAAYNSMYASYKALINTIASAYNYNTKADVISARIRKYDSARQASLSGDNINEEVYDNLVKVVNENLPAVHKYMEIRKKLLKVDELQMHDIYVPLVELPKKVISYEEALDIMRDGLAPLGKEYIDRMNKGIDAGWIDVYENQGKTSGAYSFGSYDSMPYILLNYTNTLKDVFTIVHEMGHSMHSSYTREFQPYSYGSHSIFTAEVASTVNESLLMHHLLGKEKDPEMKKYLLNLYIEEFRTTLFRQTMFAEFEHLTHNAIEEGQVLTADWMCNEYEKLNIKYFGPALGTDDIIKYEWARIPHFYNAFYVYKYATGYSAATALSEKILNEGPEARDAYVHFLTTGESDYPINLLKGAGVDMSSSKPIEKAMETFKNLVDEFEKLV
ncbi:MAG: oligoendopeptidase F [Anaerovoracaceae bacterium]